jgi:hypothetical protein
MKYLAIVLLALVAVFRPCPLHAQAKPRTETQIVHQVLAELPYWRNLPSSVHIDGLPVSYQEGKVLELNVESLNNDLATSETVSTQILARARLSDQILLMGLLGDLENDISTLQVNLMDFAPTVFHDAKYQTWLDRANNAVKKTNSLAIEQMNYVTARADQMESSGCK